MRERLMTAGNSAVENGHLVIRDRHGVARLTSNPADAPRNRNVFDVNGVRLGHIQRLIEHRYDGPCDCDGDVHLYLSAAFNAIALGLQLKRRTASLSHFANWARKWCPVADRQEVADLAARVIARPRRIKAATLGRMLGLSSVEYDALGIEAIYPSDDATFERRKKVEKAERDRVAKERHRRQEGRQALADIMECSEKAFCYRHGISARTLRYHKSKGPEAVAKFLIKKGIKEKLPQDGASIDEYYPLMERQGAATIVDETGGGRQASQPAHSGLVINLDISDEQWDRLLEAAENDRERAALEAAAASATAFRIKAYDAAVRKLSPGRRAA